MTETAVPVLYLDLDGTVRSGRIVGVSNQGGIALGYISYSQCAAVMMRTHELTEGLFDRIAFCVHHPAAKNPEMAHCWCRKPSPGLIIESALDLARLHDDEYYPPHLALMVGDRDEDRECARLAGMDFEDAATWRSYATG